MKYLYCANLLHKTKRGAGCTEINPVNSRVEPTHNNEYISSVQTTESQTALKTLHPPPHTYIKLYSIYLLFMYFLLFVKSRQMNFLFKD